MFFLQQSHLLASSHLLNNLYWYFQIFAKQRSKRLLSERKQLFNSTSNSIFPNILLHFGTTDRIEGQWLANRRRFFRWRNRLILKKFQTNTKYQPFSTVNPVLICESFILLHFGAADRIQRQWEIYGRVVFGGDMAQRLQVAQLQCALVFVHHHSGFLERASGLFFTVRCDDLVENKHNYKCISECFIKIYWLMLYAILKSRV